MGINGLPAVLRIAVLIACLVILVYWIQRWLIKSGIVRNNRIGAPAFALVAALAVQIWFPTVAWWYSAPLIGFAAVVGTNRADLSATAHRGRWWWKSAAGPSEGSAGNVE